MNIKIHSLYHLFGMLSNQKENLSLCFRQFDMDSKELCVSKLVSGAYEYFFLNDWNYN